MTRLTSMIGFTFSNRVVVRPREGLDSHLRPLSFQPRQSLHQSLFFLGQPRFRAGDGSTTGVSSCSSGISLGTGTVSFFGEGAGSLQWHSSPYSRGRLQRSQANRIRAIGRSRFRASSISPKCRKRDLLSERDSRTLTSRRKPRLNLWQAIDEPGRASGDTRDITIEVRDEHGQRVLTVRVTMEINRVAPPPIAPGGAREVPADSRKPLYGTALAQL